MLWVRARAFDAEAIVGGKEGASRLLHMGAVGAGFHQLSDEEIADGPMR